MTFVLVVRLAGDTYDATGPDGGCEWPPHPARLWQALVAVARRADPHEQALLRTIERLPPPDVIAPSTTAGASWMTWTVTSSFASTGAGRYPGRVTQQRAVDRITLSPPWFEMLWNAELTQAQLGILQEIAGRVSYVGRASSLATVEVAPGGPQLPDGFVRWVADPARGRVLLRVPYEGYTDALDAAFDAGRSPRDCHWPLGYRPAADRDDEKVPAAAWPHLLRWRLVGRQQAVPASLTLRATAALRAASIKTVDGLDEAIQQLVGGHRRDNGHHAAFLGFPHVGVRYADGHLLGVGVAFPDADSDTVTAASAALRKLKVLRVGGLGSFQLTTADEGPWGLNLQRWVGPARRWQLVLPAVLDGHGDTPGKVRRLLAKGCRFARLPQPDSVTVYGRGATPLVEGSPLASIVEIQRAGRTPAGHAVYAELEFPDAVAGPLVVGSLRHFGLGLGLPQATP